MKTKAMGLVCLVLGLLGLVVPAWGADLYVTSNGKVGVYDGATGAWKYDFGSISQPEGIALAPNGKIWVASAGSNCIYRYNSWNNVLVDTLTGVTNPMGLTFGPDGNAYVAERFTFVIKKFDGVTGQNLGTFATVPGTPVLAEGLVFGPDGNLYVTTRQPIGLAATVERFSSTGTYLGTFATLPNDYWASGIAFSTTDWASLWVMGYASGTLNRINPTTGALVSSWGGHNNAVGVVQGPNGYPYTANEADNKVVRYTSGWGGPGGFATTNMTAPQWLAFITPVSTVTVAGTVTLQDYSGDPTMVGVRIELRPAGGGGNITQTALLGAGGSFSLTEVPAGTYDVAVKACAWLQKVISGVDVTSNPNIGSVTLISGDCDNDNKITSTDLSIVLTNLDQVGQ